LDKATFPGKASLLKSLFNASKGDEQASFFASSARIKGDSGRYSNYKGIKQLFSFESIHKAHTPCILLPTSAIWPNKDFEQLSHTLCNDYKGRLHAL
jgi:hypothetical protein